MTWELLICASLVGGNCADLRVVPQESEQACYAAMETRLERHRHDRTKPPVWMVCRPKE